MRQTSDFKVQTWKSSPVPRVRGDLFGGLQVAELPRAGGGLGGCVAREVEAANRCVGGRKRIENSRIATARAFADVERHPKSERAVTNLWIRRGRQQPR